MKNDWSSYRAVAILPLLAVIILYAVYISARHSYFLCRDGSCNESIPDNIWKVLTIDSTANDLPPTDPKELAKEKLAKEIKGREITALRYSGRMTWYFLGMINLFVCIAALAVAFIVILHQSTKLPLLWAFLVLVLSFLVGLYLYNHAEMHMAIFLALFEKTITDVPSVKQTTNLLDSLGNAAAFSLLLASCATLSPSYTTSFPEGMKELSKRMKYLRTILYAGTLLLILTVLLKKSIYQWSLAYTSQEARAAKTAASFVSNLLTVEGGFYTLVLVAVYLPAAFVLQRRASLLDKLPTEEPEKEKKLQEYGMTFSFKESLPRILAILGPILVGPIGEFLNRGF
jgi:hypothetical protein